MILDKSLVLNLNVPRLAHFHDAALIQSPPDNHQVQIPVLYMGLRLQVQGMNRLQVHLVSQSPVFHRTQGHPRLSHPLQGLLMDKMILMVRSHHRLPKDNCQGRWDPPR